jgi:hypothetical protein
MNGGDEAAPDRKAPDAFTRGICARVTPFAQEQ